MEESSQMPSPRPTNAHKILPVPSSSSISFDKKIPPSSDLDVITILFSLLIEAVNQPRHGKLNPVTSTL